MVKKKKPIRSRSLFEPFEVSETWLSDPRKPCFIKIDNLAPCFTAEDFVKYIADAVERGKPIQTRQQVGGWKMVGHYSFVKIVDHVVWARFVPEKLGSYWVGERIK